MFLGLIVTLSELEQGNIKSVQGSSSVRIYTNLRINLRHAFNINVSYITYTTKDVIRRKSLKRVRFIYLTTLSVARCTI
jgi:hypothetical protein